jgi:hypothetical protein
MEQVPYRWQSAACTFAAAPKLPVFILEVFNLGEENGVRNHYPPEFTAVNSNNGS